ncbi:MAG TPA: hypothetical protein VH255_00805, partial [Verrucomicrobiae bacterium]|nr:hypothetical protein [Verrucomicrobiae bacterium]
MKKIILWSTISLVLIGAAVWAILWLRRPQVLTLSDGTKLTLLGVEYGKHHKFPDVKVNGVRHAGGQSFNTPEDTLIVWLLQEHKGNNWPNYQALVYDRAETGCTANWARNNRQIHQGLDIVAIQLDAFPRRDSKFLMRFQTWGSRGQTINKGQFVISNPVRGPFPTWTPTALPATESDGDLDVTLTHLTFGVKGFNNGNGSQKGPESKAVLAAFTMMQNGSPATNWAPVRIETSDATGNHNQNQSSSNQQGEDGEQTMTYQWGLWPNESAWKLRVEMSRSSSFSDDEVWTVTDIPVRPGSQQEMWGYNN